MLFTGIRGIERSVATVYLDESAFLKFHRRLLMPRHAVRTRYTVRTGFYWLGTGEEEEWEGEGRRGGGGGRGREVRGGEGGLALRANLGSDFKRLYLENG